MSAAPRTTATPYRAVWRWHFYAGLLVAPVLLVLAVTGALYLFHGEIDRWWHGSLMNVAPGQQRASAAAQEAAVRAAHPGASIRSVEWPHDAEHASTFAVRTADGQALAVFVDPWRAVVTGSVEQATRPSRLFADLHGELLLGRGGSLVVELAACWTLVMLATGLYLWWPRRGRWRGVWLPRLTSGPRKLWRDLHAVPAALNAVLVAFLVLSGLPWSAFWGEQLAKLGTLNRALAPTPNFSAPPPRGATAPTGAPHEHDDAHAAHAVHDPAPNAAHDAGRDDLPWSVRQAGAPAPQANAGATTPATLASVMAIAHARGLGDVGPRLRVFYPGGPQGVFTVSHIPARAQDQRTIYVDPTDGRVLHDLGWADYSTLGRTVEWGVMAHMGRQFGAANRWLALAVCVALVLTLASGVVMWWRRRPAGTLGAPDASGQRLPRGLVIVLVALGVSFPLAGLSMLAIALGEGVWRGMRRATVVVTPGLSASARTSRK